MEDQVLELRCIAVHGWNENVTCLLAMGYPMGYGALDTQSGLSIPTQEW